MTASYSIFEPKVLWGGKNFLIILKYLYWTLVRFAAYRAPPQQPVTLKPLFFEVPLQETEPLFIGRHWLVRDLAEVLESQDQGIIITGNPGTGKTAMVLQLVDYSCFGRRHEPLYQGKLISFM